MAYLGAAEEVLGIVTLDTNTRTRSGPYSCIKIPEYKGERLMHEKFLDELLLEPLSVDQMKKRFPEVSYVVEEIMDDCVKGGWAEKYKKNNKTMFKLTKEGRELRKFWLRWNKPDLYGQYFKDGWTIV